ncbi:MAG: hypothetical protein ACT4OQ_09280 [Chloroflexota bacterium]
MSRTLIVSDGHHRVALARQEGGAFIDAEVTRIRTSHELHPNVDILELVHTEQHRRLNERTHLHEVAPEGSIAFSRPTYYGELLRLIQAHAYELSEAHGEFVSLPEATGDWYPTSWLPAIEAIEASGLRCAYDFKTHGDLYLWTSQKLRELRTTNPGATWTDAAALLARVPVDRTHRRETVAARRKPLPPSENPAGASAAGSSRGPLAVPLFRTL